MCKVSGKLKLCSCSSPVSRLKNYWVYYRFVKGKYYEIVGEPTMPIRPFPEDDIHNRRVLKELLNDGNMFDVEMNPKPGDWLELSFLLDRSIWGDRVHYGFEYKRGMWVECDFDWIMTMIRHNKELHGKMKHATQKIDKLKADKIE